MALRSLGLLLGWRCFKLQNMKVAIVGTGYVGLVSGACFAELGHDVVCHDIDEAKIEGLKNGKMPIYEIGLIDLVSRNTKEGRLNFTTDIAEAVQFGDIVMSAVGTPPDEDHKADLKYVKEVARSFGENLNGYKVFVNKSTVPVGTADMCEGIIAATLSDRGLDYNFDIVSNPEFLREGRAIDDTFNPDRIVVGLNSQRAKELMEHLYNPLVRTGKPLVITDIRSSELIKYAANCFLATKISFINEMANLCDKVGADIKAISRSIGLDERISSKFLHSGIGYGGSCFPKDVKALIQTAEECSERFSILRAVDLVNEKQKLVLLEKFKEKFKKFKKFEGIKVGVWGLSFKPNTDDLRCAPSLEIIKGLLNLGVEVKAFDPVAMENFKRLHGDIVENANFSLCEDAFSVLKEIDCLMVLTEWNEFRGVDLPEVASLMRGNWLFDGRNIYEPEEVEKAELHYQGIGRNSLIHSSRNKHAGIKEQKKASVSGLELKIQSQR